MRYFITLFVCVALAGVARAESALDNKVIDLEGGRQVTLNAPITLPFEGALAEGEVVHVRQTKTAKEFPATLRNGEFVFVPEGAMPTDKLQYVVEIRKDKVTPRVAVTKKEGADQIDVVIDDVPFTSYHFNKDLPKPFLWPVLSEGGVGVTRDFPMGEKTITNDHPHHRSMWTAFGELNGVDCWAEGEKSGYQTSGEVTFGSGDGYGWIHAANVWTNRERQPVINEEREYRFYPGGPEARLFDVIVTFTAAHGDVHFGDTKEGGIFSLRIRDDINAVNGTGLITNADGKVGEKDTWGKPSAWCDFSGPIEGTGWRGVTVFDNPGNLRYPSSWHVRNYGLMGANVFGLGAFSNGEQNGEYTLKNGETLTFKYRIYVHSGNVEEAKTADRYADYVTPPKAAWSDTVIPKAKKQTKDIPGHENL